jgi:hypothetical protein
MRIIKRGKLPEDKNYEVTCLHCKSIIEFNKKEGQVVFDPRDGNFITFICPVCNNRISTNE